MYYLKAHRGEHGVPKFISRGSESLKKITAFLLVLALGLSLCGCGSEQIGTFTVLEEIGQKQYASLYRQNDKVSQVVEAAIQVLAANGTMASISQSWLGSNKLDIEGDISALEKIEEMPASRMLIIGVDTDAPPYAYYSGGQLVGMSVDTARAIGSLIGWSVQILPVKSSEIESQLASGNIDCALGFAPECVDPGSYCVGASYISGTIVLAVPSGSEVTSIRKIKGERVGTISDPALEAAIAAHDKISKYSSGTTVYLTPPRCITALENGWCVAIVMDELMLAAYASTYTANYNVDQLQ